MLVLLLVRFALRPVEMRYLLCIPLFFTLMGCSSEKRMEAHGYAQGSTYSIIYVNDGTDLQYQIDSILVAYDRVLSTYQPNSFISKWNEGKVQDDAQHPWFTDVVKRAAVVSSITDGSFDITVKPLMDFWFGNDWDATKVDSAAVDSILDFVGWERLLDSGGIIMKRDPRVQLDVNAIAQGHSVDVVADYLRAKGCQRFLVEIGGEIYAQGNKPDDTPWKVGIDRPDGDGNPDRNLALSISLTDKGMATSGNYRKFVEVNGERLGHSLNPRTGYPATTDVLSATVLAADAATADAYATACMVMGLERSKLMLSGNSALEGVLIYSENGRYQTWISAGIVDHIAN